MRILALLLILTPFALPAAAAAQPAPKAAADSQSVAFEAAVADAKAAMMADPGKALAKADVAIDRAREIRDSRRAQTAMATAQWLKGEAFIGVNRPDAAAPMIASALALAERVAPNTKLHGDLMRSRGALAAIGGRAREALGDFQRAFAIFTKAGEARSQAIALQDIGQIYWDAGDYQNTLKYYSRAGELYTADPAFTLTSHNNRGEVLRKLGRHAEAEREYGLALKAARSLASPLLEVRILSNLSAAQVENGKVAAAARTVAQAEQLSRSGEAAGWKPFVLGAAAKVAAAQGDLRKAASLLGQTFTGLDLKTTPMPFVEFHQLAADVYEKLGERDLALQHLKAFQRLDREAQKLTASTSAQLAAAQFDFATQNLRISQLKQGQLERDIRIERQQSQFRTIVLVGLIVAGGIIFALMVVATLRIRRSRNEVRAANTVLTQVNEKLEKALRAKTDFLAMTSHEIRTPLNGILGMTQILLASKRADPEMREQIQLMHGAGETMRALVDDILDVAKMETGEIAIAHEATPLRRILEDAARLWQAQAAGKGLTLSVDLDAVPAMVLSDGARIRQIVFNLLSNAVKFTPEGSVDLRARADDEAHEIVIEVQDTGIGIPADQHERVFEAFHQVDAGTTRQFGGTGLGLSICRNLASALGGTIALDSSEGKGSRFIVRLPLARAEAAAEGAVRPRPGSLAGARLLLLEANPMTQGVVRTLLEPVVGQFDCVEHGVAALDAIRHGLTDHLLVEARSAAMDGANALEGLRQLVDAAGAADIPVSILVAPGEELPLGEVAALGATQLIVKPIGGAQIVATLGQAYPAAGGDEPRSEAA